MMHPLDELRSMKDSSVTVHQMEVDPTAATHRAGKRRVCDCTRLDTARTVTKATLSGPVLIFYSRSVKTVTSTLAAPARRRAHPRALLLLPAGLCLLAGLDGALLLLGLGAPVDGLRLQEVHGPLMVLGFVGTVVALERAVALRALAGYTAPALLGAGGILALSPAPLVAAQAVLLAGTVAQLAVYARLWRRQVSVPLAVEILGAAMAVGAAGLWLAGALVPHVAPWLVGYLVLTVLGERIELGAVHTVLARPQGTSPVLVGAVVAVLGYVVSACVALLAPAVGYRLLGLSLLAAVLLVARLDVARRTVHGRGVARYMASAMLAGYGWLVVAAATWVLLGPVHAGPAYDAVLHAVFLGFVISMVMAHAPVILPAVLRRPLPYRPVLYAPLVVLHAGLVVRLLVGDAWDVPVAVQVGGVTNVVALLLFVVLAAASVVLPAPRPDEAP